MAQRENLTLKSSETMQMRLSSSFLYYYYLFFITFLFLHLSNNNIAAAEAADDFIRSSCNETLYPDICYSSLSIYANSIHEDPGQLAQTAISVTLTNAQRVASFISNLTGHRHPSSLSGAVDDCAANLDDAIDEIRGSLEQMQQLRSGPDRTSGSFRFGMSNVQTWMSAALTDEETCTDGFDEVPDDGDGVKADVCGRAAELSKLTSNALALVNSYVNKQQ